MVPHSPDPDSVVHLDPRAVPGYDRARALGLTPQVSPTPPTPITANSKRLLLAAVGWFIGGLIVTASISSGLQLASWGYALLAAAVLAGTAILVLRAKQCIRREYEAGYARIKSMVGYLGDRGDPEKRWSKVSGSAFKGPPWDFTGMWILNDSDGVASPPDDAVLPVGHYPSPNRPGELELWTGTVWAYQYRRPSQPYL